ncbi:uncharacterized protein [Physcomitrium patens]|uniref:F-box domain-containing protein n=1 Tax=Physcomitrium patens TaxID=3218 RepID=A9S8X6_PHYPA|nr:uncharacterized protein LOC112277171 [Physcomitrium patens]PNR27716.1 hypothetical protein PHYPA_029868 [Physcomitrium patens]|eukprot:XP_024364992.1 uncharacterized protein LOC112277171 [Physcomitrella patens]
MASPSLDSDVWQHIPPEILEHVVPRLPVEAIFRLRSVCKKWHQLPFSVSFRRSCVHPTSQSPFLVAMRYVDDLRLTPVLSSNGTKWLSLDLTFLHRVFVATMCDRINAVSSDGGLLCVCALNRPIRNVIVVCNPLTKKWKLLPDLKEHKLVARQVAIRVDKASRDFKVYVLGEDLPLRRRVVYLYESRSDLFKPLLELINCAAHVCGAFWGDTFYTISRDLEVVGYDVAGPGSTMTLLRTGIFMHQADRYKMLTYDDRLFCATSEQGTQNLQNEITNCGVVEFRIYELKLPTRECIRVEVGLLCLFVYFNVYQNTNFRYDWDFVEHQKLLILVARSGGDDPQNIRWLEVPIPPPGSSHRFPPLSDAFSTAREVQWRPNDKFGSRSLLLTSLDLDLNAVVPENLVGVHFLTEPQPFDPSDPRTYRLRYVQ